MKRIKCSLKAQTCKFIMVFKCSTGKAHYEQAPHIYISSVMIFIRGLKMRCEETRPRSFIIRFFLFDWWLLESKINNLFKKKHRLEQQQKLSDKYKITVVVTTCCKHVNKFSTLFVTIWRLFVRICKENASWLNDWSIQSPIWRHFIHRTSLTLIKRRNSAQDIFKF